MNMILFGSTQIDVTYKTLDAMQPHVRSECLALMRERGMSEITIAKEIGVDLSEVVQALKTKHFYNLPKSPEYLATAEEVQEISATALAEIDISRNGLRLLRRIGRDRQGWTAGKSLVSKELGLAQRAAERAMEEVMDRGLVVRVAPAGKGQAGCYCATAAGTAMLEQANAIAAAEA
jgi:hypothetical protein